MRSFLRAVNTTAQGAAKWFGVSLALMVATPTLADQYDIQCPGIRTDLPLCRNPGCPGQANPTDNITIKNVPSGALVTLSFTNPNTVPVTIDFAASAGDSGIPNPDPLVIPANSIGQAAVTVSNADATNDGDYSFQAQLITPTGQPITYAVQCALPPRTGSIKITKTSIGGDGTFNYTTTGTGFSLPPLVTSGGTATQTVSNLLPGAYTIEEIVPAGWALTDLQCGSGGSVSGGKATINVTADTTVACTFTNTKKGSITITKNSVGGDGTFNYSTTGTDFNLPSLTTSGGTATQTVSNLQPGTYTIEEIVPTGWSLASLQCGTAAAVAGAKATITLGAGANVACTYTNTKKGSITITKNSVGGNGTFNYTTTGADFTLPSLTTSNGTATQTVNNLAPGTYSIKEVVPAGWSLTSLQCSTGGIVSGAEATINLAAGANVSCTYTNTKQGSVGIAKQSTNGFGSFGFAVTGPTAINGFSLTTSSGQNPSVVQSLTNLAPGDYTFTETMPGSGWKLTAVECTGTGLTGSKTNDTTGKIVVASGATGTCTFKNTLAPGGVIIAKQSANGIGTFPFTVTGPSPIAGFSLTTTSIGVPVSNAASTFAGLIPGNYDVKETLPGGWTLSSVTCSPNSGLTVSNVQATGTATIAVASGAAGTCTFNNTLQKGNLTIAKIALGGDGSFNFSATGTESFNKVVQTAGGNGSTGTFPVNAGSYTIVEGAATGFDLTKIECSGGAQTVNLPSRSVSIEVSSGANVTCTFTNSTRGSITVRKNALGGDATFGFQSSNIALPGFNLTTSGGTATKVATGLPGGTYAITETVASGWKLENIVCTGGNTQTSVETRTATITLVAGGDVTCTFTNVEVRERTRTIIRNFMARRGDMLTGDTGRPRLVDRMNGGGVAPSSGAAPMKLGGAGDDTNGRFSFATSLSQMRAAAQQQENARLSKLGAELGVAIPQHEVVTARPGIDIWIEGTYSYYDYKIEGHKSSGNFGLFRVGADYLLRPWVLVGALIQFDQTGESSTSLGYRIDGRGWMAGPYVEFKLTDNLILDLKGLWGKSSNDISPFLTYTDTFDTTRWLLSARLTGSWKSGNWHFSPRAEVVGYQDKQHAYTDTNGILIDQQTLTIGRVIAGPEVSYQHRTEGGGLIEPRLGVKGLYTFSQDEEASGSSAIAYVPIDKFRARIEAGIKFQSAGGARVEISGSHEGFGESNLSATTGKMQFTLPLQ